MAEAAAGAASRRLTLLSVSSVGGVDGGLARYSITTGQPTAPGQLPWVTFGVNTVGTRHRRSPGSPSRRPSTSWPARCSCSCACRGPAGRPAPEGVGAASGRRGDARRGTVIARNTSSLSLDVLAGFLAHPERLIGLHFFNPVPASRLVEVVLAATGGDPDAGTGCRRSGGHRCGDDLGLRPPGLARCGSPISSGWTSASESPSICTPTSASASRRPTCSWRRLPEVSWDAGVVAGSACGE